MIRANGQLNETSAGGDHADNQQSLEHCSTPSRAGAFVSLAGLLAGAGTAAAFEADALPAPFEAELEPSGTAAELGQLPALPNTELEIEALHGEKLFLDGGSILSKAQKLLQDVQNEAARQETLNTIGKDFKVNDLKLTHLAPGLVSFRAASGGQEKDFVAYRDQLFVISGTCSERQRAALTKVQGRFVQAVLSESRAARQLSEQTAYKTDYDLLRNQRSLKLIDTERMPAAVQRQFRKAAAAMARVDRLFGTLTSLEERVNTIELTAFRAGGVPQAVLHETDNDGAKVYRLGYLEKRERLTRLLTLNSKGVAGDLPITEHLRGLGKNSQEAYLPLRKAGSLAIPALRDVLNGKIEYPAAERASARLAAAYLLAKAGDTRSMATLLKIVRGDIAPADGYVRRNEIPDALIGLGPRAQGRMQKVLSDPSVAVRDVACRYFTAHPSRRAAGALRGLLKDGDAAVRSDAALALGALGDRAAVTPLIALLRSADPDRSALAAQLLARYPDRAADDALITGLRDANLAEYAVFGAVRSNSPRLVAALAQYAAAPAADHNVLEGLVRWAARGRRPAQQALVLTSFHPAGSDSLQQSAEQELVLLSSHLGKDLQQSAEAALKTLPKTAPEWQRSAFQTFVTARKLGIEFIHRIPAEHRAAIFANRLNPKKDARPLAIMVMARGDHNGAFYASAPMFSSLINHKYRVMYYEADNDRDLAKSLKDAAALGTKNEQRAQLLVFGGHGSQSSLYLERDNLELPGRKGLLDPGDEAFLKQEKIGSVLAKDGQIVLDSCSNGAGGKTADGQDRRPLNMANFMRRLFPHAKAKGIWSATKSYSDIDFRFDDRNRLIEVIYPVPEYRAANPENPENRQFISEPRSEAL